MSYPPGPSASVEEHNAYVDGLKAKWDAEQARNGAVDAHNNKLHRYYVKNTALAFIAGAAEILLPYGGLKAGLVLGAVLGVTLPVAIATTAIAATALAAYCIAAFRHQDIDPQTGRINPLTVKEKFVQAAALVALPVLGIGVGLTVGALGLAVPAALFSAATVITVASLAVMVGAVAQGVHVLIAKPKYAAYQQG